ncbi:MAG: putative orf [Candidatus Scalindua rubra]|uniref:Putative orf n=1 Tax=Candidatus Scalindua rubra TaxID=1872076 RepID=A0A1E3XDS0_9BACT|nr:MAG: putative orf [Candidatus Scalindua rubra]
MGLIYEDLTEKIIDAAFEVHKTLGCGFLEAVYQEAIEIEFGLRNIPFESQKQLEIKYKGVTLRKKYSPDFLVFNKIILEIKAEAKLTNIDEAQLHNYLKATGFKVGLLINFGTTKIVIKRIVK